MKDPDNPDRIIVDLDDPPDDVVIKKTTARTGSQTGQTREPAAKTQRTRKGTANYCMNCGAKVSTSEGLCSECGTAAPKDVFAHFSDLTEKAGQFSARAAPQIEARLSNDYARYISPGIFSFAFLSMFLPFIGAYGFSINVFNLVFGIDLGFGARLGGHWAGVLLLLIVIAGIGLGFWRNDKRTIAVISVSALGLLLTIGLAVGINMMVKDLIGGFVDFIQISLGAGFYLLFLSFLAAGVINFFFLKTART